MRQFLAFVFAVVLALAARGQAPAVTPPATAASPAAEAVAADDPAAELEAADHAAPAPARPVRVSLWHDRMSRLDAAYPWLHAMAPTQWISIGILLLVLASLAIHGSVTVAGSEGASFSRSFGLGVWYFVTGAIQVAMVPGNHFTAALMLLANPTMALFWLTGLFGLTRVGASTAFAVQLGFVALGYGILELVTAILASIGMAQA